jgi:hypothetical protein
VRTAKFVPRKQWVVCGADDMFVRVYNYNTMDKVKQFEAHTDYIRWGCRPRFCEGEGLEGVAGRLPGQIAAVSSASRLLTRRGQAAVTAHRLLHFARLHTPAPLGMAVCSAPGGP